MPAKENSRMQSGRHLSELSLNLGDGEGVRRQRLELAV
jgi:hypothetical protein